MICIPRGPPSSEYRIGGALDSPPPSPHQGSVFDRASVDAGSYDLGGREHRDSIQDHRLKAQWERDCQWLLTISGSESEYHQQSGGADTRV